MQFVCILFVSRFFVQLGRGHIVYVRTRNQQITHKHDGRRYAWHFGGLCNGHLGFPFGLMGGRGLVVVVQFLHALLQSDVLYVLLLLLLQL